MRILTALVSRVRNGRASNRGSSVGVQIINESLGPARRKRRATTQAIMMGRKVGVGAPLVVVVRANGNGVVHRERRQEESGGNGGIELHDRNTILSTFDLGDIVT